MKNDLIDKREFLIDIRRLNKEREGEERIERWEIENDIINERIIKGEGKINKEEEGVVENILIEIDGIESCKEWEEIMDCRIEEIRGMGGRKDIGWNERIVDEENIVKKKIDKVVRKRWEEDEEEKDNKEFRIIGKIWNFMR